MSGVSESPDQEEKHEQENTDEKQRPCPWRDPSRPFRIRRPKAAGASQASPAGGNNGGRPRQGGHGVPAQPGNPQVLHLLPQARSAATTPAGADEDDADAAPKVLGLAGNAKLGGQGGDGLLLRAVLRRLLPALVFFLLSAGAARSRHVSAGNGGGRGAGKGRGGAAGAGVAAADGAAGAEDPQGDRRHRAVPRDGARRQEQRARPVPGRHEQARVRERAAEGAARGRHGRG